MILQPNNIAEISHLLKCANERGEKISSVNLGALNRVVEHKAEDMTATVEAGMTLADFQKQLSDLGQWLPIDPPHPNKLYVGDLLSKNLSGPRRFGYGTVGDYLIGLKVVLVDGRIIASGGKVVKNVAGYDLAKLFIGSRESLGVIAEATFKLRPLSEAENFVAKKCESPDQADTLIEAVLNSELTPIVFDLHNLSDSKSPTLVLGFAGTREEVEWQSTQARELGFNETGSLNYESQFWADAAPAHRLSVLPSKAIETIKTLNGVPFVARGGNGIIYHRGTASSQKNDLPIKLTQRLKNEFDPKNIFPELPL
jgi:FAD/FMN-containing dehydrogenase